MRNSYDHHGIRISYLDEGSGPSTVCLVHGFPLSAETWRAQIDALSSGHRVIAPDLAGFGESDAPEEAERYSIPGYAEQVAGLIAELGVAPVVLVGLSMGGYIVLDLVSRRPELVRALVLADTRAEGDTPEGREKRESQQSALRDHGDPGRLADGLLDALIGKRTPDREAVMARMREVMVAAPAAGWIGALQAMKTRADVTDRLAGIGIPTLVIVGEDDALIPVASSEVMHGAIPGSSLVVVPGVGHLSNVEDPESFNAALVDFVNGLS